MKLKAKGLQKKKKNIYIEDIKSLLACLFFPSLFQKETILHTTNKAQTPEAGTQNPKQDYVSHRMQHKPVVSPQSFRSMQSYP